MLSGSQMTRVEEPGQGMVGTQGCGKDQRSEAVTRVRADGPSLLPFMGRHVALSPLTVSQMGVRVLAGGTSEGWEFRVLCRSIW